MRLICLAIAIPLLLPAAPTPDVTTFIRDVAEALAQDNSRQFLSLVSPSLPEYQSLRDDVESLLARYEVASTVEILRNDGDDTAQRLELDWVLSISDKAAINGAKQTRRALVKCSLRREGKSWKIVSLEPARFFR